MNKLNEISSESLNLLKMSYKEDEEIWKYTSSKNFDKFKNLSNKKGNIEKYLNHHSDNDILIVNNRLINNPFNQIKTNNLAETINDESIFNLIIPKNKNKFILYNTAYFNDGVTFQIPDNSHIQESLYINNIIDFNDINSYLNCRFLFTFGNNVNATIIIKDIDLSSAFLNIVYEVFVGENSKINFIIDSEKPNTTQIFNLGSEIKANSDLNIYTVNTSGKLLKNNYFINLNDINSSFNYNSINLLNNNDYVDNYIEIIHNNKHTISNTNQKNILSGKSNSVFYSKAIINQNGAKSEVIQKNNNILLSENANVHSNPQLEIYNDDVKCSHGSTTGQLDDEAIFYIRSRGISLKDAHKLLLNGFLNEFTSSISDSSFKENISKKINDWLSNVN